MLSVVCGGSLEPGGGLTRAHAPPAREIFSRSRPTLEGEKVVLAARDRLDATCPRFQSGTPWGVTKHSASGSLRPIGAHLTTTVRSTCPTGGEAGPNAADPRPGASMKSQERAANNSGDARGTVSVLPARGLENAVARPGFLSCG